MNKILLLLTLIFCVAMAYSCQSLKSTESADNAMEVSLEIDEGLQTEITIPDTLLVELEEEPAPTVFLTYDRGYCFGMCPVFKSTILTDGSVRYEGINFVDVMGNNSSLMSTTELNLIKDKLIQINYFELEPSYDNELISDLPSVNTSASLADKSHQILDRYKAPKELKELYMVIDSVFATLEWSPALEKE